VLILGHGRNPFLPSPSPLRAKRFCFASDPPGAHPSTQQATIDIPPQYRRIHRDTISNTCVAFLSAALSYPFLYFSLVARNLVTMGLP
jgi:hypothetical protein